jgi:hypothetical protein
MELVMEFNFAIVLGAFEDLVTVDVEWFTTGA